MKNKIFFLVFFLITKLIVSQELNLNYVDKDGLKQGLWHIVDTLTIIHCSYVNDTLTGDYYEFWLFGEIKYQVKYFKGKKHGLEINYHGKIPIEIKTYYYDSLTYYESYDLKGRLEKRYGIKNGKFEGNYFSYINGKLISIRSYSKGKLEGFCSSFDKKGRLRRIKEYRNNKQNGKFIVYNKKYQVKYWAQYKDGMLIEEKQILKK